MHSNMTRRQLMQGLAAAAPMAVISNRTHGNSTGNVVSAAEKTDETRSLH